MTSIVKMMKEQGNQFDWSQVVLDFAGLPCFKQGEDVPGSFNPKGGDDPTSFLADGYTIVGDVWVVKITGENPSVEVVGKQPVFTDCEPVIIDMSNFGQLSPVRLFELDDSGDTKVSETFMLAVSNGSNPIFWLDEKTIPGAVVYSA